MYRILKYITLIAILCLANPVTIAQSSNNNWISISGNTSFDILADTDLVIVYVPIKLKANISLRVISFDLFDVSLGNRHEMRLINAIKLLPYNNVGNVFGPAILIQLDLKQIKIQGPYNLQFLAMTKGMPDAYLNLTVNIPAATLRPEGPVVIDYASVLWKKYYKIFHRGSPKNFNEATLNLQEVSGKSRLTEIQIYSLGFYDANNRKIEGNLEFPKVPTLINPYGSSSGKYKLTGNFPLGTVNGKVEILSLIHI